MTVSSNIWPAFECNTEQGGLLSGFECVVFRQRVCKPNNTPLHLVVAVAAAAIWKLPPGGASEQCSTLSHSWLKL